MHRGQASRARYRRSPLRLGRLFDIFPTPHDLAHASVDIKSVKLSQVKVLKQRTLQSAYRDADYPGAWTPFYLYGTEGQHHVDHMLVRAPNTQISSARVLLDISPTLDPGQLARGVIARVGIPERALQPMGADQPFTPRRSFPVKIYADDNDAEAQGPGLSDGSRMLADGSLELGDGVYTRAMKVDDEQSRLAYLATGPNREVKSEWAQDILTRLRA